MRLDLEVGFVSSFKERVTLGSMFFTTFHILSRSMEGLFARIIMIGTLTALQWFIYDYEGLLQAPRSLLHLRCQNL